MNHFDPSEARRLAAMVRGWGPKERQQASAQLLAAADLVEAVQAETISFVMDKPLTPDQMLRLRAFSRAYPQQWPIIVDSDSDGRHAFIPRTAASKWQGPSNETCDRCGCDPRNAIHNTDPK